MEKACNRSNYHSEKNRMSPTDSALKSPKILIGYRDGRSKNKVGGENAKQRNAHWAIEKMQNKGTCGSNYSQLTNIKIVAWPKDEETIFMTGVDAVTTLEEVKNAIRKWLRTEVKFKIQPLRAGFAESRRTEIALKAAPADMLLHKVPLRIGYRKCQLRKRLKIVKCTKCLLSGHEERNCTNEDRSKLCYYNGGIQHTASKSTQQSKMLRVWHSRSQIKHNYLPCI